jgi:hypothetical protein
MSLTRYSSKNPRPHSISPQLGKSLALLGGSPDQLQRLRLETGIMGRDALYSDVPATDDVFSLPNSSSKFCQALGSFFVANGSPVSE